MIVGDFNAHSQVLDSRCEKRNPTGKMLEDILTNDHILTLVSHLGGLHATQCTGQRRDARLQQRHRCHSTPETWKIDQ